MTILSPCCPTEKGVHIIGLESPETTRMKLGPGLGITAHGLVMSRGQRTSPTTTTAQSSVWRSTSKQEITEGGGMMKNALIRNTQFVTKVCKADGFVGCCSLKSGKGFSIALFLDSPVQCSIMWQRNMPRDNPKHNLPLSTRF